MKPAIRVENLSKLYQLGSASSGAYRTLRESLNTSVTSLWQRWRSREHRLEPNDLLWALREVSFAIEPGTVAGIIGRNGAGKSTLLKVLSRITEPTSGRVELRGRIGSLLEVGTGFHAELTGRENIYLSGAILGMTRRDMERRFDDIVAFAEVERFLDTPVKRFSSGMYVRLAFAVAAHLEPDILLVDEVLAVGDATFQKRCIDRMSKLAASGRTILFVSHNMDLIPRLFRTGILLERGRVTTIGAAPAVVEQYLAAQVSESESDDVRQRPRSGDGRARFTRLQLLDPMGQPRAVHISGEDLLLRVEVEATQPIGNAALAIVLRTISGTRLISSWTREAGHPVHLETGSQCFECCFKNVALRPGQRVSVMLWMEANGTIDALDDARVIEVIDSPDTRHYSTDPYQGVVLCDYFWQNVTTPVEVPLSCKP